MRQTSPGTGMMLIRRIRFWYALILAIMTIFLVKLFYLQILKYDYYSKAALADQLKQNEIPATRGVIYAHDGDSTLPLVLNQKLYTLFADPKYIKSPEKVAIDVQKIIGGKASDYEEEMRQSTRYSVLAKKLPKDKKEQLDKLNVLGLGTRVEQHRTYPQGSLAAALLGFVNDEGEGKYGLEQFLNKDLKGKNGLLKAITDAQGVPLLADPNNVIKEPANGKSVLLSVDLSMQKQAEDILKAGLQKVHSKTGDAIIINPNNGAVKVVANYPSYNPEEFYKVKDPNVFNDAAVSAPLEVGSVMKTLTAAAALNQGVVNTHTSYYDPGHYKVDGFEITNIEEDGGPGTRTVADILQLSLNTGATWLLMQMGGGNINSKARNTWHDYMVNHYQFGKLTGIEQGYESPGIIPDPNKGYGLDLQYANTAFGQGMTATPIQLAGALSAVLNGGIYYRPHLVEATIDSSGKKTAKEPEVVSSSVVKPETSRTIQSLMEHVVSKNHSFYGLPNLPKNYSIGGKTGTAQISKPGGGYYENEFNGIFVGFVGGNKPEYVIVVRVDKPTGIKYAGSGAAAPIFSNLAIMLINNFGVTPKT